MEHQLVLRENKYLSWHASAVMGEGGLGFEYSWETRKVRLVVKSGKEFPVFSNEKGTSLQHSP